MHSILTIVPATAPPGVALATLADVKTELGITDSSQDAALTAQIATWSNVIATLCRRTFGIQTVVETFRIHRFRNREKIESLPLTQTPVIGDIFVTIDDIDEPSTNYELSQSGVLWRIRRHWYGKVSVTYTGGYDLPTASPAALSRACIELIKEQRYAQGRDPSIRGIAHGDARVDYWVGPRGDATDGVPSFVLDLISPFKNLVC